MVAKEIPVGVYLAFPCRKGGPYHFGLYHLYQRTGEQTYQMYEKAGSRWLDVDRDMVLWEREVSRFSGSVVSESHAGFLILLGRVH